MERFAIYWSAEARKNLHEIIGYIRLDAPQRALEFGKKLDEKVNRLKLFPKSGRRVPELYDQIPVPREIFVGEYGIIYCIALKWVEIVAVIHGRRLFP